MSDLECRPFRRTRGPAPFRDAICMAPEAWAVISDEDLLALKELRFAAWLHDLENPPAPTPGEPDPIVDFGD